MQAWFWMLSQTHYEAFERSVLKIAPLANDTFQNELTMVVFDLRNVAPKTEPTPKIVASDYPGMLPDNFDQ